MGRQRGSIDLPSIEAVRRLFFVSNDGVLKHSARPDADPSHFNQRFAGKPAGWTTAEGDRLVRLDNNGRTRRILASRIAFAVQFGRWPTTALAHANGDVCDDSAANLVAAPRRRNRHGGISFAAAEANDRALLLVVEAWRIDYNESRPHMALGNQTPQEYASRASFLNRMEASTAVEN
jgi:hypothetical protein